LLPRSTPPLSRRFGDTLFELVLGDITEQDTDAIVNAANSSLLGGGGVDGAIHRTAGPQLLDACRTVVAARGRLPAGEAVLTPGFGARARFIIHTVGPVWQGGSLGEEETLARCYRSVLAIAREHRLTSVALPSLSTGAYGYPIERAAPVAVASVRDDIRRGGSAPSLVRFVLWAEADLACYARTLVDLP
jgi:O-acetyl-ADP-ribose deacetylase (regulator of RNase III)